MTTPHRSVPAHTVVDPALPTRIRRRLTRHDPAARARDHRPSNRIMQSQPAVWIAAPLTLLPVAVVVAAPVAMLLIGHTGHTMAWKNARLTEISDYLFGLLILAGIACGTDALIGMIRAARRRARWLRRRYTGHYIDGSQLAALTTTMPHLAGLISQAQHHRQRLTSTHAWRCGHLPATLTEHHPDIQEWQLATTVFTIADTMDAVNDAAEHPELASAVRRGQHDIAAATVHLRATITRLAQLADAATTIDAAITTAHAEQTRHDHRDQAAQKLAPLHTTLTAACTVPDNQLGDAIAAARAAADYTATNINPTR